MTVDFQAQTCQVRGLGEVHLLRGAEQHDYAAGKSFDIRELGTYHPLRAPEADIPAAVWQAAVAFESQLIEHTLEQNRQSAAKGGEKPAQPVPGEVQLLVDQRQEARQAKDWALADQIRKQIASLGWQVKDTPAGPVIRRGE